MVRYATTFSEYADILARNAPHALILGEWRRLDRAIDEYYARRGKERPSKPSQIEADVARDPLLGLEASCQLRGVRGVRNPLTHEDGRERTSTHPHPHTPFIPFFLFLFHKKNNHARMLHQSHAI